MNSQVLSSQNRRAVRLGGRITGALVIITSLVSLWLRHRYPVGSLQSLFVALLPVPFLLAGVGFVVWSARQCDELHRRIQFEALAFAYPAGFALLFVVMSLQSAEYLKGVGTAEVMLGLCALYAFGLVLAHNRYR